MNTFNFDSQGDPFGSPCAKKSLLNLIPVIPTPTLYGEDGTSEDRVSFLTNLLYSIGDEDDNHSCLSDSPTPMSDDPMDGIFSEKDRESLFSLRKPPKDLFATTDVRKKGASRPPNISGGLGQNKTKRDLRKLEDFAVEQLRPTVFSNQLYIFDSTHWTPIGPRECRVYLRTLFKQYGIDDTITTSEHDKIYELLLCNPDIQREKDFSAPPHCLNLVDGVLNLSSMRFCGHESREDFLHCLRLSYMDIRQASYGEVFEGFVDRNSQSNPHFREQILELVMLTLLGYDVKRFFVLLGPSNTGKTEFIRFLMELVGRENVASISGISDFSNRFTTSALEGKLLCTCLDLPDAPLPAIAVGTMKQLVGDDPVKVEAKYKDSRTIYRKPLLVFCGNHPILIPNISKEKALINRMVVIPFGEPVKLEEQRQHLYQLLLEEAPYIVNKAILAYRELMNRNFIVTLADTPDEYAPQDARDSYRSVQYFVDNYLTFDETSEITTTKMYQVYEELIMDGSAVQMTCIEFSKMLSEILEQYGDQVTRLKRAGKTRQRGYRGISLSYPSVDTE